MIRRGEGGRCGVGWAFMVARGWGWDHVPPKRKPGQQDTATHQGPYGILGLLPVDLSRLTSPQIPGKAFLLQTSGENACHPERSEGSGEPDEEMLRCAQHDSQNTAQVRSRGK